MAGPIVTRFAPSPTGHLHVGGARTALYNWALAGRGGRYLLRIEDTDRARSSAEAAAGILEDLAWLGIDWAEGPVFDGRGGDPHAIGPFFQAQRLARYTAAVETLIDRDLAYPAFETVEEIDALRRQAQADKGAFRYRRSPGFDRDAALARRARGDEHVVRFRMPEEAVAVSDAVLGDVEFGEEHLDDFVILKRDGFPTYHLSVVVDDEAMGVTHVLRGQEHLNNTPRHVALQRALGYAEPVYVHLPIIFNLDGSKMSKRDKDRTVRAAIRERLAQVPDEQAHFEAIVPADQLARWRKDKRAQLDPERISALAHRLGVALPHIEVEDFRAAGYLPEVLCNYLALLGWSPGEKDADGKDLERFDRAYLAERFGVERIGRGNAKFDPEKLTAFNQDTIAGMDDETFFDHWKEWGERYAADLFATRDEAWLRRYAAMVRTRCRTLLDAASEAGPGGFALVPDDAVLFDPKAVAKHLAKGDPSGHALLGEVRAELAALGAFEPAAIEDVAKALAEGRGVGLGKVAQPLRVAVTGAAASPPLGETLAILGREAVLARIDRCLAECG